MKTLFTTWFAALLAVASMAQSPGGVSSGLVSWFKADAGTSTTTTGATIASWIDQSPSALHASQATAASRPLYYPNIINGHPAVRTSSARFFNVDWSAINDQNYTIYTVTRRLAGGSFNHIVGVQGTSASYSYLTMGYSGSTLVRHIQYGNMLNQTCEAFNSTTEIPTLMACQFDENVGKALWRTRDGITTISTGTNKTNYPYPAGIRGRIGRGGEGYGFNGYIAEVIVYNRVLTNDEKARINTYFSVKYGLSVPASGHQYALDATHHNDVFGIARDNAFALAQTTSESVGLDDILQISNPSAMNNGEYLICGNDNGAVSFGTYAGSNCSYSRVLARDWKFNHIGDVGTVNLRFDLTGITGFVASDLRLLVDIDSDGYDDETPLTGTFAGNLFTVAGVTIPDDARITLCTVNTHYYAVLSGVPTAAIWATTPTGTPGFITSFCDKIDLTINAGVTLTLSGTVTCRDLNVLGNIGGGALQSDNLNIHGNVVCNGSFNTNFATVTMLGTAAQNITGTQEMTVYNWNIINNAGVSINNTKVRLINNLGFGQSGGLNAVLNTNNKLELISNASGTGEIQSLTFGTLNGNVTINRFRPPSTAGWTNLSSPAQSTTIADWNDDLLTTGFPGSDSPGYNFNSVVTYNESVAGDQTQGYVGATSVNDVLVPGLGYMVYMPTGSATIDYINKPINSGMISLPVTYTDNGTGRGWNMVGNPYPATISWASNNWTKTNIANEVHVWNPNSSQYVSYTGAVGQDFLIAPGQSFCVRANGAAPQLIIREDCKTKSHGTFRSSETATGLLTLHLQMDAWQDQTIITRMNNTGKTFDESYDAFKLRSPIAEAPYMATLDEEGDDLSINVFNKSDEETTLPIRIEAGVSGTYTLTAEGLNAFAQGGCVTLEDVFTGTVYVLSEGKPVQIPLEAGDRVLRYQLRIGAPLMQSVTNAGCADDASGSATVKVPATATSGVNWYAEPGKFIGTTSPESGMATITGLTSGLYTARIENEGACGTTEVSFEISQLDKLGASAVVMPATCANTDDGAISISVSGGESPYVIEWNNGIEGSMIETASAGKYSAHITDKNGCAGTFEFEVPSVSQLLSKFEVSQEKVELVNGSATVEFTNASEHAEAVVWNFGDGSDESVQENPTHTYMNAGTYEVMLKATHENCESFSTKTIAVTDDSHAEEFAGDIVATLTDNGVQMNFFFSEPRNLKISAYNVLGQQLIEPIIGLYGTQTIMFSDSRYASQALIEVTDLNTGEKALIRLGR